MPANMALVRDVRSALASRANPEKAPQMQRYMKSAMPYLGVPAPPQNEVWREVFSRHPLADFDDWRETILVLWRNAGFREERYGAIALSGWKAYRSHQTPDAVPMYEEMIVAGAWWDYVDAVAIHRVGPILKSHPDDMVPQLVAWSEGEDHWKRRAAIIAQVGFKSATDTDLLTQVIEPSLTERDFFLRKGIGWALRELAKTDPDFVEAYLERMGDRLSPLSRREAARGVSYGRARQSSTLSAGP